MRVKAIVDTHMDQYAYANRERFNALATISTVAAALLVVATFSEHIATEPVGAVALVLFLGVAGLSPLILVAGYSQSEDDALDRALTEIEKEPGRKDVRSRIEKLRSPTLIGTLPFAFSLAIVAATFLLVYRIVAPLL